MPNFTPEWLRAYEERQRQRNREYSRSATVVEPAPCDDPLGSPPLQETNPQRIIVRVCSVRERLLDEDNLAEKFVVDALRYCGLIPDDCPETTKIEVSQRKCGKGEPEFVTVVIEPIYDVNTVSGGI